MASFNGELVQDGSVANFSTFFFDTRLPGYIIQNSNNPLLTTYYSNVIFSTVAGGYAAFNYPGGGGTFTSYTIHYHKRTYSNTLVQYVEWDTTYPDGAYPGGGSLSPPNGIILYSWVTTP